MKETSIFEVIWPYVYEGIDKPTGNAIFHDTLWDNHIEVPRLMEFEGITIWEGDELILPEQGGKNPLHPNPAMRDIPAVQKRFKPGDRLIFPKQRQFLRLLDHFDKLSFGGAGGGGKSRILAMSHLWKHSRWRLKNIMDVKSAMFCETIPDLNYRQISMIHQWIPQELFTYHEVKRVLTWNRRFGSGTILYMSSEDTERLRSIEFGHVTVDEASRNPFRIVGEISSRVRDPRAKDRSFGLATNPGGIGTGWYKRDLVDETTRIKPKYDEQFKVWRKGTFHIQCLPTENPLLGPDYYSVVNQEPPHVRDAILYGKWDAHSGTYFAELNPYIHQIQPFRIPDNVIKWRGIDIGTFHPFVCVWYAFFPPNEEYPKGRIVQYREYSVLEKIPSRFKAKILEIEREAGDKNIMGTVLSPDAFRDKKVYVDDHSIAEMFNEVNKNVEHDKSLMCIRAIDDRIPGWRFMAECLRYEATPVESGSRWYDVTVPPRLQFFNTCKHTWTSISNLIHDKVHPEDVQKTTKSQYYPGQGDDEGDASRYVIFTIAAEDQKLAKDPYDRLAKTGPFDPRYEFGSEEVSDFATF